QPPTSTTHLYPLSLHDALPISAHMSQEHQNSELANETDEDLVNNAIGIADDNPSLSATFGLELTRRHLIAVRELRTAANRATQRDRKSTRLNSSHVKISYAVFC